MELLFNPIFLEHETGTHPENKNRLTVFGKLKETQIDLTEAPLSLIHSPDYISFVRDCSTKSIPLDADTLTSPRSFTAAVAAVNATLMAAQTGQFALVRPPGHHAHPSHGRGFCLFNNIAIAVAQLVRQQKRVAIFDFDGHFGDGTAACFYHTDNVLYCSLHQGDAYPGGGTPDAIGDGPGKGYTVNLPVPPESGDDIYGEAVETVWPVLEQYAPDVIAVSAGFDGHHADPLLTLHLTTNTYYRLGRRLADTGKPLFATLEGGYNTETLPACVYSFLEGINHSPHTHEEPTSESRIPIIEEAHITFAQLHSALSPYWNLTHL